MFERITLHGESASLVFVYHTAAKLTAWQIQRAKDSTEWTLTARVAKSDAFQLRQRPLLFTAPHEKGFWRWEVNELHLTEHGLRATLGQPL